MLSAKGLTPVVAKVSLLVFHSSCCVSEPVITLNASSFPALVSHGEILAHLVSSSTRFLGIAQSYLDRKLHMTTTQSISSPCLCNALNTLRAIPELPNPPFATHRYWLFLLRKILFMPYAQVFLDGVLPSISSLSSLPSVKLQPPANNLPISISSKLYLKVEIYLQNFLSCTCLSVISLFFSVHACQVCPC